MNATIFSIIFWYGVLLLVGWSSFPLCFVVFSHSPDRGGAYGKILGIFLLSYASWLLCSLGWATYQRQTIIFVFLAYAAVNLAIFLWQFKNILAFLKHRAAFLLLLEALFLLFFLGAVLVRMYNPDLTGAEKEADLTLLNAVLQTATFPPADTWFAGAHVNYYYFGYVLWATIMKATGIIAPVGFNLALATIVGLGAVGGFGLVYHLTRRVSWSAFASCLLMVFGNLDGLMQVKDRYRQWLPFDWWRSSRVIPDTINEFPYFSFLLGDLHAHFMAIPGGILCLVLCLQGLEQAARKTVLKPLAGLLLLIGLSLGGTAVTNGWDYPTYVILAGLCVWGGIRLASATHLSLVRKILLGLAIWGTLLLLSRVSFWPFYQTFTPQLTGENLRFVSSLQRSGLKKFMIIHGFFLLLLLPWAWAQCRLWLSAPLSRHKGILYANSLLLSIALLYVCPAERVLFLTTVFAGLCFLSWYRDAWRTPENAFVLLVLALAFAILAGCEVVYIQDFYGHPLERQNTVFKFYYQAWLLLSLGVPACIAWPGQHLTRLFGRGKTAIVVLGCAACSLYPILATYEKTNHFRGHQQGGLLYIPTLNGLSYLAYKHPYEYEALSWIQDHIEPDAVILEATGHPYSFFGRVATTTGRPTVLGWGNHEALWRDPTWKSILQRTSDIQTIYDTTEKTQILPLLRKYQIHYIYVGTLERETYAAEGLNGFASFFSTVYENRHVTIYRTGDKRALYSQPHCGGRQNSTEDLR